MFDTIVVKLMLLINEILKYLRIQVIRYPFLDSRRRIDILKKNGINKIFDIGANTGIYAQEMRKLGYTGEIFSFEPLSEAFKSLSRNSAKDDNWQAFNYALGNFDGQTTINVSKNSASSSILQMLPLHADKAAESVFIDSEAIEIRKLDSIFNEFYRSGDKIFMKIDTQGYEKNVLEGVKESITKIMGIQIELSSVPLYKESPNYLEMMNIIESLGFSLYSIENGFCDKANGRLLQFDAIYIRE